MHVVTQQDVVAARRRTRPTGTTRLAVVAAWVLFAALGAVHVHIAVRRPGGPDGMSDLGVYAGSVQAMLAGGSLYGYTSANGDQFTYPPVAGWLFTSFALVDPTTLRVLWTVLQCAEVAALAWLVAARSPVPLVARQPRRLAVPVLGVLLHLSYPVFSGLFLGQISLLITLLALLDATDVTPRGLRGVPTGLAAAVKLTPLAFVPYLWLTGRRRAAGVAAATFAAATGLGWLLSPGDSWTYWTSITAGRDFLHLGQADNQSLVGWLARAGWWGVDRPTVLVAALLVSGVVLALGYRRARALHADAQLLAGAVVVGAAVVVASPISWSHHQTAVVLGAACLLAGRPGWASRAWSVGVYLLFSIPAQAVLLHLWPAGHPLTDAVLALALAVACLVPFSRAAPADRSVGAGRPVAVEAVGSGG